MPKERKGWLLNKRLIERYQPVKKPAVDLDTIFGGFEVTLPRVSRMEVRDVRIGSPVIVTSQ